MDEETQRTRTELTSVHASPRRSAYVILLCGVAAIGGFLFGFDSGVINGTVDALARAFGTDVAGTGFAVASVLLGCAFGAFGAGRLADSLGRRATMLLNAVPMHTIQHVPRKENARADALANEALDAEGLDAPPA